VGFRRDFESLGEIWLASASLCEPGRLLRALAEFDGLWRALPDIFVDLTSRCLALAGL
jgi:hypothetical protein